MTNILHKLALLLCLLAITASAFAGPEAEYKKLSKAYTLNADGSQEFRYSMELTLFTHTAMNGTYGESFIVYNPQYQGTENQFLLYQTERRQHCQNARQCLCGSTSPASSRCSGLQPSERNGRCPYRSGTGEQPSIWIIR